MVALLGRLERRADVSDVALPLARSLAQAVGIGAATDIVLGAADRAELLGALEDWSSEGELPDDLRWLRLALHGERLPWEALRTLGSA